MSAILVFISCLYNTGCGETTQTYYLNDPQLQEDIKYTEAIAEAKLGDKVVLYSGSLLGAIQGRDFSAELTTHVFLQGNVRWPFLGVGYSYKF